MIRLSRTVSVVAAIVLLVGACSSGSSAAPSSAAASSAASASASAAASAEVYTLAVAEDPKVGKFLTGEDGKTLYVYSADTEANKSACADQCAANWPPLIAEGGTAPQAGAGVTGTIATFTRADGGVQVSYNGKPLYYFVKDTKAGDTTGQGVGGKWTVAAP